MKKQILLLIVLFSCRIVLAQQDIVERVYISTDRDYYIAGESIMVSLFLFGSENNDRLLPSNYSRVVYLELVNSESGRTVQKIASIKGRGAGHIEIPVNFPTGNYKLIAYTKQMLNEKNPHIFEKIIPVFNTISGEFVKEGIIWKESIETQNSVEKRTLTTPSSHLTSNDEFVTIKVDNERLGVDSKGSFKISNESDESISLSLSIVREDLISNELISGEVDKTYPEFIISSAPVFDNKYTVDYEGEVVKVRVLANNIEQLYDTPFYLSSVAEHAPVYVSYLDKSSSTLTFFTSSLVGRSEVVLVHPIINSNEATPVSYEIVDPFLKLDLTDIPKLKVDSLFNNILLDRSVEMQVHRFFGLDTIYSSLPDISDDPLLSISPVEYILDNYTRFPSMSESVLEFISEMRFRNINGSEVIQVRKESFNNTYYYTSEEILVLLDGVPIFDHSIIYKLDPYKVERISIYPRSLHVGESFFESLVMINTFKKDMGGVELPGNYKFIDYKGVDYPVRTKVKEVLEEKYPDIRSMLYWDPAIEVSKGGDVRVDFTTSSIPGRYKIVLEGVSASGESFCRLYSFEVICDKNE